MTFVTVTCLCQKKVQLGIIGTISFKGEQIGVPPFFWGGGGGGNSRLLLMKMRMKLPIFLWTELITNVFGLELFRRGMGLL